MKKFAFTLVVCAVLLCACTVQKNDYMNSAEQINEESELVADELSGADEQIQMSDAISEKVDAETESETKKTSADSVFEAFFDGSKNFVNAYTGEEVTVFNYFDYLDYEYDSEPVLYSVVDLDRDGKDECLVEYEGGNTVILHEDGSVWTGYEIAYRERLWVKVDGSMSWSDGAAYSGVHRVEFSNGEMKRIIVLDSDFMEDIHYINGELVTSEDASKAWEEFDSKENAEWLWINPPEDSEF